MHSFTPFFGDFELSYPINVAVAFSVIFIIFLHFSQANLSDIYYQLYSIP